MIVVSDAPVGCQLDQMPLPAVQNEQQWQHISSGHPCEMEPAHRPQGALMVRKHGDEDNQAFQQQLSHSIGHAFSENSIFLELRSEIPDLGEEAEWLRHGRCSRIVQLGFSPHYLAGLFNSLPPAFKAGIAAKGAKLDEEEESYLLHIRHSRARLNLDLIDSLLGSSSHKEQLACGQCEFNLWETAEHGVLCYMWDRKSSERIGCYVNPRLAQMSGIDAQQFVCAIAAGSLPQPAPELDHTCFNFEGLSSSAQLCTARYARWRWPGGAPKLLEFVDRKLYDQMGRTCTWVTFVRELSPEEWDAMQCEHPELVRPLALALGDRRSGRELLADFDKDMALPLAHPAMQHQTLRLTAILRDRAQAAATQATAAAAAAAAASGGAEAMRDVSE